MKRSQTSSRKTAKSSTGRRRREEAPARKTRAAAKPSMKTDRRGGAVVPEDRCAACDADLRSAERALFVEEEVGRVFCSEKCITMYFQLDIERLEKEYLRLRGTHDLSSEQRERYAHLRWVTLEAPDEGWCEKTVTGDLRYTFISEFQPDDKTLWMICVCLMLRGEPSFLFIAIPTRNRSLVQHYRKGEPLSDEKLQAIAESAAARASRSLSGEDGETTASEQGGVLSDTIAADGWSREESARAGRTQERTPEDIPEEEFPKFEQFIEETLAKPDEVWALPLGEDAEDAESAELKIYHFLRRYPGQKLSGGEGFWYVVVAKDTEDDSQIELLDSFPTRDPGLLERYRSGELEYGSEPLNSNSRLVH
jgi:hypothetical protein